MSDQQQNGGGAGATPNGDPAAESRASMSADAPATNIVEAEKMATLGRLLAGIAHEINTPLGAVRSNNEMLEKTIAKFEGMVDEGTELSERKLRRLLATIHSLTETNGTALDRIKRMVNGLKRYAHRDVEQSEIDLRDVIDTTLTLVHHELKYRITLEQHFDDGVPKVSGVASQLSQVLTNLLVNAAQAIEGKGTIDLSLSTRGEGDQREVVLTVTDSGPGIPPAVLARIFEAGFTTKPAGVGSGLGLAISMEIMQKHGGSMEVESTPGEGATFRLILPAA